MRRLETIKDKKYWGKNNLLLRILAVIGRCGPHLIIVMKLVTKNNSLKRSRNFRPSLWILSVFFNLISRVKLSLSSSLCFNCFVFALTTADNIMCRERRHVLAPATIIMCRERRHAYCWRRQAMPGDKICRHTSVSVCAAPLGAE